MQIGLFKIPVIRLLLLMILSQCYLLQAQWTRQSPIPTGQTITNVCFINPDTGWVFGYEGSIFRTNDRGETWIDQSLPIADVAVGLFLDENQGWIGLFSNFFNN